MFTCITSLLFAFPEIDCIRTQQDKQAIEKLSDRAHS